MSNAARRDAPPGAHRGALIEIVDAAPFEVSIAVRAKAASALAPDGRLWLD
jgi:hypothetical protein